MKKVLLPALTVCLIFGLYQLSPYGEQVQRAQLTLPTVKNIQETVTLYGEITDSSPIRCYANTVSTVSEVYVEPGDWVRAGQPLMLLEPQQGVQGKEAESVFRSLADALETGERGTLESAYDALQFVDFSASEKVSEKKAYFLYSTQNGIVLKVSARKNDTVGTWLPCVEICAPENLGITAAAGEDTVGKLKENMKCSISVSAFSLLDLRGTVTQIYPYAKKSGLFTNDAVVETAVRVQFENANEKLRPGYRAAVKVTLSQTPNALLLPYEAISQDAEGREYVMKYQEGIVKKQFVETGAELADFAQITDGLGTEDLIFLEPELLKEGSVVFLEAQ